MSQKTILVVDDDPEIRDLLSILLTGEGFSVVKAADGPEALSLLDDQTDLVILDVMMPGLSGYQTCRMIRENHNLPILFLTAKTLDSDLTMGFSSGGDDYLAKPFSCAELLARVKGLLRRYHVYKGKEGGRTDGYAEKRGLRVRLTANQVTKYGKEIQLTDLEYKLLRLMMSHPGKVFSAENLYESVWQEPYFSISANTVMVHIRKLRAKVEDDPQNPKLVRTVWGKGYRIE